MSNDSSASDEQLQAIVGLRCLGDDVKAIGNWHPFENKTNHIAASAALPMIWFMMGIRGGGGPEVGICSPQTDRMATVRKLRKRESRRKPWACAGPVQ